MYYIFDKCLAPECVADFHSNNFIYDDFILFDYYIGNCKVTNFENINNKRDLPWRENKDPYRVWISEIILQQTKVLRFKL